MQEKRVFQTQDGSLFETKEEAEAHETMLSVNTELQTYSDAMLAAGISKNVVRSRMLGANHYMQWRINGKIQAPKERKKVDKAAKAA